MSTILIFLVGITAGILLLYLLGIGVSPYNPDSVKQDHFECGVPPSSEVPKKANFNYFIFAIAFIVFDMAGLFFSLFAFSNSKVALSWAMVFGLLLFIAISISMKEYRNDKSA
jgi:NADH-quinone oxidoreductase subunit A